MSSAQPSVALDNRDSQNQYELNVTSARSLVGSLLIKCSECTNLDSIGKRPKPALTSALSELLTEMQEQSGKMITAIKSSRATSINLQALQQCLQEIKLFLKDLQAMTLVFPYKAKLKRTCLDLAQKLTVQRSTLFNSVTMAVLSQPNMRNSGKSPKPLLSIEKHYHHTAINPPTSASTMSTNTTPTSAAGAGPNGIATELDSGQEIGRRTGSARSSVPTAQMQQQSQERQHAALVASGGIMLYSVGHTFYYGMGRGRNYTFAFASFKEAAEAGDHDGMHMLSRCYRLGNGCEKNIEKSLHWLMQAATGGSATARTEVGMLIWRYALSEYYDSTSNATTLSSENKENHVSAIEKKESAIAVLRWMQNSTRSAPFPRNCPTLSPRGQILALRAQEVASLLLQSAQDGHVEAQSQLGLVNEELSIIPELCNNSALGIIGLDGDVRGSHRGVTAAEYLANAHTWYSSAADEGCSIAARQLGLLYLRGKGMEASRTRAYEQFSRASQAGDSVSHYLAGLCAERGVNGAEHLNVAARPDLPLALGYYERGAAVGQVDSMYSYGHLLVKRAVDALAALLPGVSLEAAEEKGIISPADKNLYNATIREGIFWLRTAANAGSAEAAYQLGRAYEQGIGVPVDLHSALEMYEWALETAQNGKATMSDSPGLLATAAYAAGNVLYSGFGTHAPSSREARLACAHYYLAANYGHTQAMNAYGLLLEDGRACEHFVSTLISHAQLTAKGTPEQWTSLARTCLPLPVAAAQYYLAAAHKKHGAAMVNLAQLLASGALPDTLQGLDGQPHTALSCVAFLRDNFSTLFEDDVGPSAVPQLNSMTRLDATKYFNNMLCYLDSASFASAPAGGASAVTELVTRLSERLPPVETVVTPTKQDLRDSEVIPGTLSMRLQELAPLSPLPSSAYKAPASKQRHLDERIPAQSSPVSPEKENEHGNMGRGIASSTSLTAVPPKAARPPKIVASTVPRNTSDSVQTAPEMQPRKPVRDDADTISRRPLPSPSGRGQSSAPVSPKPVASTPASPTLVPADLPAATIPPNPPAIQAAINVSRTIKSIRDNDLEFEDFPVSPRATGSTGSTPRLGAVVVNTASRSGKVELITIGGTDKEDNKYSKYNVPKTTAPPSSTDTTDAGDEFDFDISNSLNASTSFSRAPIQPKKKGGSAATTAKATLAPTKSSKPSLSILTMRDEDLEFN